MIKAFSSNSVYKLETEISEFARKNKYSIVSVSITGTDWIEALVIFKARL